ncbi:MAG: DMT family transporter [Anaerolineales bacterium]
MTPKNDQIGERKIGGLFNLLVVYFVWGSTYLAIRMAVKDDGGFSPFVLGFSRVLVAGSCLLLWGILRGEKIKPTLHDAITLLGSGLLLWVGGNGLLNWAEQRVNSGLAALILAVTPIWITIIEMILDRKRPSYKTVVALLIGFGGITVLTLPTIRTGINADILSILGLLLAGLSWGAGSVFQSRRRLALSPVVNAGYQQIIGAFGFGMIVLLLGDTWETYAVKVWFAWSYLVIFGGIFAFTSYVRAIELLPIKIVATYAYVNPVIAVFLGWLVLGEPITMWTLVGTILVLTGVWGIYREKFRS